MPVPAACPLPTVVLMSTIAGLTLAAMASVVELLEPVLGATAWIGDWGCVACAAWRGLTARARLQPMPAPATAATTAIRTAKAATRVQIEPLAAGGGGGIHAGGGPRVPADGGARKVGSDGVGTGCSGGPCSFGFSVDIDVPPVTPFSGVLSIRLPVQPVRRIDGSLAFPGSCGPQCFGDADAEGKGDAEGDDTGEPDGEGDADGDGEAEGDGCRGAAICSPGALVAGSGGGGGAASEMRSIRTSATTATAAGMASVSAPTPGRPPVLWADVLYARRSGVRWIPSAEAPAQGAFA